MDIQHIYFRDDDRFRSQCPLRTTQHRKRISLHVDLEKIDARCRAVAVGEEVVHAKTGHRFCREMLVDVFVEHGGRGFGHVQRVLRPSHLIGDSAMEPDARVAVEALLQERMRGCKRLDALYSSLRPAAQAIRGELSVVRTDVDDELRVEPCSYEPVEARAIGRHVEAIGEAIANQLSDAAKQAVAIKELRKGLSYRRPSASPFGKTYLMS